MWGQVGAESWPWGRPELVSADPLSSWGLAALASARVTLGRGRADFVPSFSSLLALSPSHLACALSLPMPASLMPLCVFVREFVSVPF